MPSSIIISCYEINPAIIIYSFPTSFPLRQRSALTIMETAAALGSARQQSEHDDSFDFDDLEGCFDVDSSGGLLGSGERREVDDTSPDDITAADEVLGCSPQPRATMLPWMELSQEDSQKSANELMEEVCLYLYCHSILPSSSDSLVETGVNFWPK